MNRRAVLLAFFSLLCPPAGAADNSRPPPAQASPPQHGMAEDCDETEPCLVEGLGMSDEQQRQVRDILQAAGKQQEDLRDDTIRRIEAILTPEQARHLEERRADIIADRGKRLRQKARQMDRRARELKDVR